MQSSRYVDEARELLRIQNFSDGSNKWSWVQQGENRRVEVLAVPERPKAEVGFDSFSNRYGAML